MKRRWGPSSVPPWKRSASEILSEGKIPWAYPVYLYCPFRGSNTVPSGQFRGFGSGEYSSPRTANRRSLSHLSMSQIRFRWLSCFRARFIRYRRDSFRFFREDRTLSVLFCGYKSGRLAPFPIYARKRTAKRRYDASGLVVRVSNTVRLNKFAPKSTLAYSVQRLPHRIFPYELLTGASPAHIISPRILAERCEKYTALATKIYDPH